MICSVLLTINIIKMNKKNELIFRLKEQLRFIKLTVTEREMLDETIKELEQAINYTHSSEQLPTREEAIIEAEKQCVYINTFDKPETDFAQINGFEKCYNWITKKNEIKR